MPGMTATGIKTSYLQSLQVFKRKKKSKTSDIDSQVDRFYHREDNSVELPLKNKVNKHGKPRSILRYTTAALYRKFKTETKAKISVRKFQKLRPGHVKLVRSTPLIQCLCMTCENIREMLVVLRRESKHIENISNVFQWNGASLCGQVSVGQYSTYQPNCIERKCSECGLEKLQTLISKDLPDKQVSYWQWVKAVQDCDGKRTTRVIKERKTASAAELLAKLIDASEKLSVHLNTASWQQKFYQKKRQNPLAGEVVLLTDFSENYRLEHQNQPQSVHWGYRQCALCPMVLHYVCPDDGCQEIVKEVVVAVSDDLRHDYFAAQACEDAAVSVVEARKVMCQKIVKIHDGAPGTYKCRQMLYLTAMSDVPVERHYFGSSHGKSLSDGEGAVAKKIVSTAVKTQEAFVDCAQAVVDTLNNHFVYSDNIHLTHVSKTAILVNNIQRPKLGKIPPVKGIQSIHCVKQEKPGIVMCRRLSCFCDVCISGQVVFEECPQKQFVGEFHSHKMDLKQPEQLTKELHDGTQDLHSFSKDSEEEPVEEPPVASAELINLDVAEQLAQECNSLTEEPSPLPSFTEELLNELGFVTKTTPDKLHSFSEMLPEKLSSTSVQPSEQQPSYTRKGKTAIPGPNTKKKKSNRENFFQNLQATLLKQEGYETFLSVCEQNTDQADDYLIDIPKISSASPLSLDLAACEIYPADGIDHYLPKFTTGDGNCLFHAVAQHIWKDSKKYVTELRVRTCMEMLLHETEYTNNSYLQRGLDRPNKRNLTHIYTSYLEEYMATKLGPQEVSRLFR